MKQKELFYLCEKELRIHNYTARTNSSYMQLLKLLRNYLSAYKIKKVSGKVDLKSKKTFISHKGLNKRP